MQRLIINIIGFNIGWTACVLAGALGAAWVAALIVACIVGAQVVLSTSPRVFLLSIALVVAIGVPSDALLRIDESKGGQSRISADDYIEGAPELIVEIATSSASYDLHDKLRAYRRNGVKEYLVWLTQEQGFRWYVLQEETYVLQQPNGRGILHSWTFPGLQLAVEALLAGEMQTVLAVLQEGVDSEDHRQFLQQLE